MHNSCPHPLSWKSLEAPSLKGENKRLLEVNRDMGFKAVQYGPNVIFHGTNNGCCFFFFLNGALPLQKSTVISDLHIHLKQFSSQQTCIITIKLRSNIQCAVFLSLSYSYFYAKGKKKHIFKTFGPYY